MGWPGSQKDDEPSSSGPTPSSSSSSSDDESGDGMNKWEMPREPDQSANNPAVTVSVHPTTGGQFTVQVTITDSVDTLKKVVSHKLKVPKERICLLYRDRLLREGTLNDNLVVEGAKIILLPSVEAGLLTLRPEQSVMQALESLNDSQVNDFLSGKAPLNLTMRLGDYMMIIQLQLSPGSASARSACGAAGQATADSSQPADLATRSQQPSDGSKPSTSSSHSAPASTSSCCGAGSSDHCRVHSHSECHPAPTVTSSSSDHHPDMPCDADQASGQPHAASSSCQSSPSSSSSQKPYRVSLDTVALAEASRNLTQTLRQFSSEVFRTAASQGSRSGYVRFPSSRRVPDCCPTTKSAEGAAQEGEASKPSSSEECTPSTSSSRPECSQPEKEATTPTPNDKPETKASSSSSSSSARHRRHGAVIEKMRHHGCGVYSGTFSGTLNPSLQDTQGRPWPGIATIIHILNDLLCANPRTSSFCAHTSKRKSSQESTASTSSASGSSEPTPAKREKREEEQEVDENEARLSEAERTAIENATTRSKIEALKEYLTARKERRKARRRGEAYPASPMDQEVLSNPGSPTFKWTLEAPTPGNGPCDTPLPSPSFGPTNSSPGTPTSDMMNVEGQSLSTWTAESEAAEVAAGEDADQQDSVGAPVIA